MSDRRERLRACPIFQDLAQDPAALDDLAAACERASAHEGEAIVAEGDEADTMYVIQEGRVRVEKRTLSDDAYTVTHLDPEREGFFGDQALLDRERRSASVVAETDCLVLVISRDRFHEWGDRHPAAGLRATRRIAEQLSRRLRRSNHDIGMLYSALVHELEQRL